MDFNISTIGLLRSSLKTILSQIPPDACFTLSGHPGAGKTTFVKTAADILQVTDNVQSPTFNILNIYSGFYFDKTPVDIFHYDFYRIRESDQLFDIQLPETGGLRRFYIFIEWPEKIDITKIIPDIDVYALTINTKYSPETGEITERNLRTSF